MRTLWIPVLLLAGCTAELPHEDPATVARRGACTALEGRSFSSVEQAECGITPDGVALCNWQISFLPNDADSTRFEWGHSDVGESGIVTCDADSVRSDEPTLYEGHFTPQLDLLWDDVAYVVVAGR